MVEDDDDWCEMRERDAGKSSLWIVVTSDARTALIRGCTDFVMLEGDKERNENRG